MVNPIETENLTKVFGEIVAVDHVSFEVREGEIYGLLGPNGAGKTTTLKMVTGILKPSDGTVRVFGKEPNEDLSIKNLIGYVPEEMVLYESLTPNEFFEFIVSIRGLDYFSVSKRISTLVEAFALEKYYNTPIAGLSMGTKQKVAIIAALLHNPPLLVLDEPLNGLDVRSAKILKEILNIHIKNGGAVLFSTHIMEIAENMCTRIGIINKGKIVAEGDISQLRKMFEETTDATLEEIFLKITQQEEGLEEVIDSLKEVF
ncbi:MAG: ABC transporter ATP-binding protein [Candidatus Asgardarchaeia archaeon]